MALADLIKKPEMRAPKLLLLGGDGTGKTTFAVNCPLKTIYFDVESGVPAIDCHADVVFCAGLDWPAIQSALRDALKSPVYDCVVIDSIDALDTVLTRWICKQQGWSDISKGSYGSGYSLRSSYHTELRALCDAADKMIIIVGHVQPMIITDPISGELTKYELALYRIDSAKYTSWCDAIGHVSLRIFKSAGKMQYSREISFLPLPNRPAKTRYSFLGSKDFINIDSANDGWNTISDGIPWITAKLIDYASQTTLPVVTP